jgi:hypothetical protein
MQTVVNQKLTEAGVLGVILMIVGPLLTGFAYVCLGSVRAPYGGVSPDIGWLYWLGAAGFLLTAISLPLVIVGRRYIVESVTQ